ncbi:MAG: cupin domain-containing protein [Chelatococcus sp.]|jgi:mannose-6-phosphate isomerase-like protein (cupin superfamily)|uniref:cupin domain-containing protein n=1 Tax=Chelatococcus sp. TaxID=1953771 RepID=UPI0025BA71B8|nr:cupin domain-containing protein [Chelatococcus sp.]MBX3540588.1 cupin domain-containing protein [Chelatococcus sp.]
MVERPHVLRINVDDVPEISATSPGRDGQVHGVSVRMVYGTETGVMIGAREEGYHSKPHHHDCEQFNFILEGELWFFIGKEGFRCKKGDFVRVPRNEVHWVWVRAKGGCTMLETHTPSLTGDAQIKGKATSMIGEAENAQMVPGAENIYIDYPEAEEIERKAFAADPD